MTLGHWGSPLPLPSIHLPKLIEGNMAPKDSPKQAQNASKTYHEFLPNLDQPRFQNMQKQDAHEYAAAFKQDGQPPWLHALYLHWRDLFNEPFRGVTTDGK